MSILLLPMMKLICIDLIYSLLLFEIPAFLYHMIPSIKYTLSIKCFWGWTFVRNVSLTFTIMTPYIMTFFCGLKSLRFIVGCYNWQSWRLFSQVPYIALLCLAITIFCWVVLHIVVRIYKGALEFCTTGASVI